MKRSDFYYELPEELIAQTPLLKRDSSRLLVLDRQTGAVSHHVFTDIAGLLRAGDILVLNDSRVIPARLYGRREGTGAAVETVLLRRVDRMDWEVLVRPGKKARPGMRILFGEGELTADILDIREGGVRLARFSCEGDFEQVLNRLGNMPLPPYIHEKLQDGERYQTVYSKNPGSAAAPTAGLHFTPELLDRLAEKGVEIARVTLHVGLGTFRPVKEDEIENHEMHSEYYSVSEETARAVNLAKEQGRRVVAVGTTSCRTLEAAGQGGRLTTGTGDTDIFIYPGYEFKLVDALITNFHLPESTLLMLISALAGREQVLAAYQEAIKERYRFFSFGDAMFIE